MAVKVLKSPLPGIVINIECKEGDTFRKGDDVVVIEAMKMENALTAPDNIRIQSVHRAEGDVIKKDDSLFSYCLLYTSPSPRDKRQSRMPSSA